MGNFQKCLNIVIAEDDEDDYLLFAEALKKEDNIGFIHWAKDGEELLNYLDDCDKFNNTSGKNPHLIILDLNIPKKMGVKPLMKLKPTRNIKASPSSFVLLHRPMQILAKLINWDQIHLFKSLSSIRISSLL